MFDFTKFINFFPLEMMSVKYFSGVFSKVNMLTFDIGRNNVVIYFSICVNC